MGDSRKGGVDLSRSKNQVTEDAATQHDAKQEQPRAAEAREVNAIKNLLVRVGDLQLQVEGLGTSIDDLRGWCREPVVAEEINRIAGKRGHTSKSIVAGELREQALRNLARKEGIERVCLLDTREENQDKSLLSG